MNREDAPIKKAITATIKLSSKFVFDWLNTICVYCNFESPCSIHMYAEGIRHISSLLLFYPNIIHWTKTLSNQRTPRLDQPDQT